MEGLPEKKKEKQMRRTIVLLTTMAMTLLVATSVAMAATISCQVPINNVVLSCQGSSSDDTMTGTDATFGDSIDGTWGDRIDGLGGNDTLNARGGPDELIGSMGNDKLDGGANGDTYTFQYNWGVDTITADASGYDTLNFKTLSYSSDVVVNLLAASSRDEAKLGSSTLNLASTVVIEDVRGGQGPDTLSGNNSGNRLYGDYGDDKLYGGAGKDELFGGPGNDTIDATDGPAGGADGSISCGDGSDTVYYDRYYDHPASDCEKKIGFPIAAPTN
jgi:large repetitive protein